MLDPVPDDPAAVADCGDERALVVADYHAGIEVGLRRDGVELDSRAERRRERLSALLTRHPVDRVVFLGDIGDSIGTPGREERTELRNVLTALATEYPVTIVKGNHDGGIDAVVDGIDGVEITGGDGARIGDVGFCHGHTWPAPPVVAAPLVCTAHEHPLVRLTDAVGGSRTERVWLRGQLDPGGFPDYDAVGDRLVVCPAFNDRSGGTVVNENDGFLSPFLPSGLESGEAYLLDGTRLGPYERA
ncbi:MAG: metallophosphoesterase superfamily enzyme [Natronomonas sp.]|jgi:metallophosphoesterase superfamily enzyme|uniref:metallophosphoesterase n=1 Tax=Natronomonas sp. TaxID=2184060 RepID=UPI00398A28D4